MASVMGVAVAVMGRPFVWGRCDCCLAVADVFQTLYGIDLVGPLRGAYGSRREAKAIIERFGGFGTMVRRMAFDAGLRETEDCAGAVGVVCHDGRPSLAICATPGVWLVKTPGGLTTLPAAQKAYHV